MRCKGFPGADGSKNEDRLVKGNIFPFISMFRFFFPTHSFLPTSLHCSASRKPELTVKTIVCATRTPLHMNLSLLASCIEAIQGHLPSADNVPLTMNPATCLLTPQELVSAELTTDNEQLKENTNKTASSIVDADCSEGGYRIDEASKQEQTETRTSLKFDNLCVRGEVCWGFPTLA